MFGTAASRTVRGMTPIKAPVERLDLSALGRAFVDDPYPVLAHLREREPVRRVRYHDVPAWLVTRFADAQAAYSEPLLSADRTHAPEDVLAVPWVTLSSTIGLGEAMVYLDPPEHTRLRHLVSRAFTARRVTELRAFTRAVAERLLDQAARRETVDFPQDFSIPLANEVIMALLGVPPADGASFAGHSHVFLSTDPSDQEKKPGALAWIRAYVNELVTAKHENPGDDLLSELVAIREDGDRLTEAELGSMALLLLMAGFETTASQLATGMLALITYPEQLAALRAEPALIPGAVEEMVRWGGAAMASLPRYAAEDLSIGGVTIPRGEAVIVSWAAANRDPRRFTEPDRFDVRRDEGGHVGYAHGIHYCLGAPLARMEMQEALSALTQRDIALAEPAGELSWRVTPNVRALNRLPVHVSNRREATDRLCR